MLRSHAHRAFTRLLGKLTEADTCFLRTERRSGTREEYEALFDRSGFELRRVIPTRSELRIIEATKR